MFLEERYRKYKEIQDQLNEISKKENHLINERRKAAYDLILELSKKTSWKIIEIKKYQFKKENVSISELFLVLKPFVDSNEFTKLFIANRYDKIYLKNPDIKLVWDDDLFSFPALHVNKISNIIELINDWGFNIDFSEYKNVLLEIKLELNRSEQYITEILETYE